MASTTIFRLSYTRRFGALPKNEKALLRASNTISWFFFTRIDDNEHLATIAQTEVRNLDGLNHSAKLDRLLAPVKLAGFARCKSQRDKDLFDSWTTGALIIPALYIAFDCGVNTTITSNL